MGGKNTTAEREHEKCIEIVIRNECAHICFAPCTSVSEFKLAKKIIDTRAHICSSEATFP